MPLQIDQLSLGMLQTNCYLLGDSETREALLIDPSDEAEIILAKIAERGYTVRQILATHAHFDHILASYPVKVALGAPFHLHADEVWQLKNMEQLARMFGIPVQHPPAEHDGLISHGEIIQVGAIRLEARFTPGHSPGHLAFRLLGAGIIFGGDCLFMGGIGRTDLPGGDANRLAQSLREEFLSLPDETIVLPGHGPQTTIGRERAGLS
jgi:glyoxylase-like metal-dependent hydrolase (beta-lactamase superfamily II)